MRSNSEQEKLGTSKSKYSYIIPILIFFIILSITITIIQLVSVGIDKLRQRWGLPLASEISPATSTTITDNQILHDIKKSITPYDFKDNLVKYQVITNFFNSVKNNKQTAHFSKNLKVNGSFSSGYLYIKASVDGKALGVVDDVYLKISGYVSGKYIESGGHLITSKSFDTPKSSSSTELLFDLTDVKYKEHYDQTPIEVTSGDWLSILNNGTAQVVIAFSSTGGNGKIEDVSFYYQCVSGSNCGINFAN